jgi:hypothetical protein
MFKKTAIAALVLGFSGAASAAMYAPAPAPACAAGNVTVPCERSAWDLGVDLLYMRNDGNQFDEVPNFRAPYGWGFRLEGSYHFGRGNDANLNWTHYNKGGESVNRMTRSKLDIVNFEMGQSVDFGENFDVRFQGGMQYVDVTDNGVGGAIAGNNARLKGFGPRGGAMVKYDFGNGFGVYGDTNIAILASKGEIVGVNGSFHGTSMSTDGSVGFAYTYAMAQGDLTARLGYGVKQITYSSAAVPDAGWQGFNFGLKWVGNV